MRKADLPRDELGRLRPPGSPDAMAHLRDLDVRLDDVGDAVHRGRVLFDDERFFEAFKHFVVAWQRAEDRDPKRPYRGVAQAAAGCCHIQRGNLVGAAAVFAKALVELDQPDAVDLPLDTEALRVWLLDAIAHLEGGEVPTFPTLG